MTGRVLRVLRSRRTAVWLLAATAIWSVLGTIVPQTASDRDAAAAWAAANAWLEPVIRVLGLHSAFGAPAFLAVLLYLGAATAACAWERTREARRAWRRRGVSDAEIGRARRRPHLLVRGKIGRADPLQRAAAALRGLGLREDPRQPGGIALSAGRWGIFGSPVFHWCLAVLFVVVAAGRLTRSEGFMRLRVGDSVRNTADAYVHLERGPLFPGFTGVTVALPRLERDYVAGGVSRGTVPVVALSSGREARERPVHANSPLRLRAVTVYDDRTGVYADLSLETSVGESASETVFFQEGDASRTAPWELSMTGAEDEELLSLAVTGLLDRPAPRIEVVARDAVSGAVVLDREFAEGDGAELPGGATLTFADAGSYAQLSLVQDWSVPWLYLFLGLGTAGLAVAVVNPYRRVLLVEDGGGGVAVMTRHVRGDAIFRERVHARLALALGAGECAGVEGGEEEERS